MANAVTAQLFIDGAYTTKTAFSAEGLEVQVGPDVETGTRRNSITLTWDNSDLSMDPSNVLSPLFGKIGLNTRCRLQVGGTVLCVGESVKWAPDRTLGHTVSPARGRAWTEFSAEGVIRRLGKWTDELRSAIYRQISSYDATKLLGYWSMEGSGTNLPNAISGGFTGKVTGSATWAGNAGPNGSDKVIQLGSDGALAGSFIRAAAADWQLSYAAQLGAAIGSGTYVTVLRWRTTAGVTYEWQANNAAFQVLVTRDDGTVLATIAATFGTGVTSTTWTRFRCKVTTTGGTVTVEPAWYNQGGTVWGTSGTFSAATSGVLTTWDTVPNAASNGTGYAHLFATTDTTLNLTSAYDAYASFNGYSGERSGNRAARLCTEEGIGFYILGASATTVQMGPQKPGLFLDLLEECARTDRAILYDEPSDVALMFRTRIHRQGQTSKLDLTYGNGTHVQQLSKVIDDVGVVNHVTVSNASGATYTKILASGPYSVLPPPNGVGRVKGTVELNQLDDTTLDDRAGFELNLLSQSRPRYSQITVDLLANPGLIAACNTIRPGDLITLAGVEPDPVRLHVISYQHMVSHVERKYVMACVPGELWDTGTYDTTAVGNVYGVKSTSLNTLAGTTGTALIVNVPDPLETWSQTATGYDLVIEGERVRVTTAFGAPTAVIGNADGAFEAGALTGWGAPSGGTFAATATQAHTGSWSGLLTTTGTPTQTYVRNSPSLPCVPGTTYRLAGWMKSLTALANVMLSIDWFDSTGSYLSTSSQTLSLTAGAWTSFDGTYAAPTSAASFTYGPTLGSSPAAGSAIYLDDAVMSLAAGFVQTAAVTRSVNGVSRTHTIAAAVLPYNQVRYAY